MASLQTLRDKGGIIVAVVIALALIAFLLGDLLSSGSRLFGNSDKVGEIENTTITASEYQDQLNYLTQINAISTGTESLTSQQQDALASQTWETFIRNIAFMPSLEKLGIQTTQGELQELFYGENPSAMVQNIFTNPNTGTFDPAYLANFQQNIDSDPTGGMSMFWNYVQNQVADAAAAEKFTQLIEGGSYVTGSMAKTVSKLMENSYNIEFVSQNYLSVPDSVVELRESELKAFYDQHKDMFKSNESRSLRYVLFETLPSQEDRTAANSYVAGMVEDFAVAADPMTFASSNSMETPETRYVYAQDELAGGLADFVIEGDKSKVYGPEIIGDTYTIARIADVKDIADSIELSYIALAPDQTATADSLVAALKKGSDFAAAAAAHSLDQSNASTGGLIGMIDPQSLPMEFTKELTSAKQGDIVYIKTPGALNIFKVGKVQGVKERTLLARIVYNVEASEATRNRTYAAANTFASNAAGSIENFNKAVSDSALIARSTMVFANQREIQGLPESFQIVRWAMNNAEDEIVSKVESIGDMFIVSALVGSTQAGHVPFEQVKADIQALLINKKKGEYLAAKFAKESSLEAIATMVGDSIQTSTDLNFNKFILPQTGLEPAVAGAVCALEVGQLSKPIVGQMGVYSVRVTAKNPTPASIEIEKARLEAENQQYGFAAAYQAFLEMCNIEDLRYKFF